VKNEPAKRNTVRKLLELSTGDLQQIALKRRCGTQVLLDFGKFKIRRHSGLVRAS